MNYRQAIGVPADSAEIEVDGARIAVAREGHGPAVVCLHAIGHGGGDFNAFASAIRDDFEVIRIDWPNQGRSGPDPKPLSPSRYAELLDGVLERLHVERPIIVGNSIGGAAALIYARRHPVRALVLCDSGGLVAVNAMVRTFCGAFSRFFAGGERCAWWFRPTFRAYYRFMVLPAPAAAEQRERIINAGYEIAPVLREAWTGFGKPEADIRDIATSLDVPIWLAWGKKDKVIPLAACTPCIRQMKNAHVTKFDAGHAAFLEQPEEFAREFLTFARTLDDASSVAAA
jgi:pimeloyl-ACP methyl ester carboxylesterase